MKLFDKVWSALGLVDADEVEEQPLKTPDNSSSRQDRKSERLARTAEEHKPRRNAPPDPVTVPATALPQGYKPTQPVVLTVGSNTGQMGLILTHPNGFDDARQIAEHVTNGKTVLVNFDRTDTDTTKRTIDFMSGITYAVGGTVQRISSAIFLFAPANVEVSTSENQYDDESAFLPWRSQKAGREQ